MNEKFVGGKQASKILGVHQRTLYQWEEKELIEDLIKEYSQGKIIVINKKDDREPEEELAMDVLQIMNVFVAKMNGLRKYKKRKNNKNNI